MTKKWSVLLMCLLAAVSVSACSSNTNQPKDSVASSEITSMPADTKLQVSVTFDAMKEFVQAVGKDKVEISTIIPTGTEAHDFEPKAQDLVGLSGAQIFVYNGLGMEPWAENAVSAASNADLIVVNASKGADLIENTEPEEVEEHGQYDPHLWLSLDGAASAVGNIRDALVQADPANQEYYKKNSADFLTQLQDLATEYKQKFEAAPKKDFVTGHAAFGYLCREFGLNQNSVEDTFAEGEPTAQQLANLVSYCKENNVTTIFAEELASPEVSQTLANEIGAEVETVYTMESAEDNLTYLQRMEQNLSRIYDSLMA